jgi:hypothetical protein
MFVKLDIYLFRIQSSKFLKIVGHKLPKIVSIFIIPRGRVSDHTSLEGGRNCFFSIPGGAKYKISAFGPKAKMIPIAIGTAKPALSVGYLYGSA